MHTHGENLVRVHGPEIFMDALPWASFALSDWKQRLKGVERTPCLAVDLRAYFRAASISPPVVFLSVGMGFGGSARNGTLKPLHMPSTPSSHPPLINFFCRERARMGEDDGHNRGRRKGVTLLRALVATFKWRIALAGLLLIGDSAIHIAQVGGRPAGHGRAPSCLYFVGCRRSVIFGSKKTTVLLQEIRLLIVRGCGLGGRQPCAKRLDRRVVSLWSSRAVHWPASHVGDCFLRSSLSLAP